jgi:hypothetical protein
MTKIQIKTVELATFTPGEAEMITGVARATQRDWRRRELTSMPTRRGWTRFTSEDLAHLIVLERLLPTIRPSTAYLLARGSTLAPIEVLAQDAFKDATVWVLGHPSPLGRPESIERYAVKAQHADGSMQYFNTTDLNTLPDKIRKVEAHKQIPLAYYIIVDLFDVADQMRKRMIKPYFIDAEPTRMK